MVAHCPVLIVGHYSHDTLIHSNGFQSAVLGGSSAYIASVFSSLKIPCHVVAKVGSDFRYLSQVLHPPQVISGSLTTQFRADFREGERVEHALSVCESILADDIPSGVRYRLGLVVGIAGEILPSTLNQVIESVDCVLCDIQGLIRRVGSEGRVFHQFLEQTPFFSSLSKISFLKVNRFEANFIDLQKVRQQTCILVTEGKEGCSVYAPNQQFQVPGFPAVEVDPTGAGDCFLAGFGAGLLQNLPLEAAVRLGNYFGALAVGGVGIPKFP